MLQPHAHRQTLALDRDPGLQQPLIGAPGRVAHGQHHVIGGQLVAPAQAHRPQPSTVLSQTGGLAVEAVADAQTHQVLAQGGQHLGQPIGPHVRSGLHRDVGGGTEANQIAQDPIHRRTILAAGVELAVRIGARPTLAETVVRIDVQPAPGQLGQIAPARLHRLAALDDRGGNAGLGQPQGREGARRPRPDDHDPRQWTSSGPARPGRWFRPGGSPVGLADRQPKVVTQRPALASVERSPHDCHRPQLGQLAPQRPGGQLGRGAFDLRDRHEQIHELRRHCRSCIPGPAQRESPTRRRAVRQCRPARSKSRQVRGRSS